LAFGEGDALAFAQLLKSHILQIGRMEKQVLGLASANEAKALVHQTLDCPFCHRQTFLKVVFVLEANSCSMPLLRGLDYEAVHNAADTCSRGRSLHGRNPLMRILYLAGQCNLALAGGYRDMARGAQAPRGEPLRHLLYDRAILCECRHGRLSLR
jgi:hypothetical protein